MSGPTLPLEGFRALLADDEGFSLSIISRMLREMGCKEVIAAKTGSQALTALLDPTPPGLTLAIIDFNMPDLNGLEILKRIRTGQTAVPRLLPVLMLTGSADGALVTAATSLDVGSFVIKPISKATLQARIAKVLSEDRELKPEAFYQSVDVEAVRKSLLLVEQPNRSGAG